MAFAGALPEAAISKAGPSEAKEAKNNLFTENPHLNAEPLCWLAKLSDGSISIS